MPVISFDMSILLLFLESWFVQDATPHRLIYAVVLGHWQCILLSFPNTTTPKNTSILLSHVMYHSYKMPPISILPGVDPCEQWASPSLTLHATDVWDWPPEGSHSCHRLTSRHPLCQPIRPWMEPVRFHHNLTDLVFVIHFHQICWGV